jgi:N-ethylmaleimide reductase
MQFGCCKSNTQVIKKIVSSLIKEIFMAISSNHKLFSSVEIGPITLGHRVVMAPLTRSRSDQPGDIPSKLMQEYYAQRASEGGLIITEGTSISLMSRGWFGAPGMYTDEQVEGWKKITNSVHAKGGRMFSQLWHAGRSSHESMLNGSSPVAPSVIPDYWENATPSISTPTGWLKPSPHRALILSEIKGIVEDYRKAAVRAKAAGFDGVELHAANGYLIDEFLQDGSNKRTDIYGGSIENRSRFLMEVVEALVSVWGKNRVAVRIGPSGKWNGMSDSHPTELFDYVAEHLNPFELAYLHVIEPRIKGSELINEGQAPVASEQLRKIFKGKIIAAGGFEIDTAKAIVEKGDADLVAFGRHFISNPDLPKRIRLGEPLNDYDRKTFYTFDFQGYTDYPFYEQQCAGLLNDPFCPQFKDSGFYFDTYLHASKASAKSSENTESKNKALVLEAFDTLFNKRDYVKAEHYWSPNYIQHSAHITPGREGLFNLIKSLPPTLKYEPGIIVAEGDQVMIQGRFSGLDQSPARIAVDILRIVDGVLTEHWDVIEEEVSPESSKSGLPMFGNKFEAAIKSNR